MFKNSLFYYSNEKMYIVFDDNTCILEVSGEVLQNTIQKYIENDSVKLLPELQQYLSEYDINSSYKADEGELKFISIEDDLTKYGLEAYAKNPSSTACPGSYGGFGQGTMSDDNSCLMIDPGEDP